MSKLVSFLCIAFVAEASVAGQSSSDSQLLPKIIPSKTSSINLTDTTITGIENNYELNTELVRIITNATKELYEEDLKLLSELLKGEKQLDSMVAAVDHLVSETKSTYQRIGQNNIMVDYYKARLSDEECSFSIGQVQSQILDQGDTTDTCMKAFHTARLQSSIPGMCKDDVEYLRRLHSFASTCNDKCVEIKKILIDLFVYEKFGEITTEYLIFTEDLFSRMKNFTHCLRLDELMKKSERDVEDRFHHLRKCGDLKRPTA